MQQPHVNKIKPASAGTTMIKTYPKIKTLELLQN